MTQGYQNVYQLDQSLPLRLLTRPASIDAIVNISWLSFQDRIKIGFMTVFMTVFMTLCDAPNLPTRKELWGYFGGTLRVL